MKRKEYFGQFFKVGDTVKAVRHNGEPFDGEKGIVDQIDDFKVVFVSTVIIKGEERMIRSYFEARELQDIRPRDWGFELFMDGIPYFGYEVVEKAE